MFTKMFAYYSTHLHRTVFIIKKNKVKLYNLIHNKRKKEKKNIWRGRKKRLKKMDGRNSKFADDCLQLLSFYILYK